MLGLIFLCTLFLRFATQTLALEAPITGYEVVDLSWELQTHPNGATMIVNGTIEEAITQLTQVNLTGPATSVCPHIWLTSPTRTIQSTKWTALNSDSSSMAVVNWRKSTDCNARNPWYETKYYLLQFRQDTL